MSQLWMKYARNSGCGLDAQPGLFEGKDDCKADELWRHFSRRKVLCVSFVLIEEQSEQ